MVRLNKRLLNKRNFERAREFGNNAYAAYKKYKFLRGEEPQEGLVPIGNSPFYMTPSEPASPFDCDRYPNSPFCGGNPIDTSPLGLGVDLVRDDCNFGVQVSGTLAFIKLPPFQIAYRNPGCTPAPKPYTSQTSTPYVPPQQGSGIYLFYSTGAQYTDEVFNGKTARRQRKYTWNLEFIEAQYPLGTAYPDYFRGQAKFHKNSSFLYDFSWEKGDEEATPFSGVVTGNFQNKDLNPTLPSSQKGTNFKRDVVIGEHDIITSYICFGYQRAVDFANSAEGQNINSETFDNRGYGDYFYVRTQKRWTVIELGVNYIDPPPPKNLGDDMCCNETKQMMQLILKRLGEVPAIVPRNLTNHNEGEIQVNSLAEFHAYTVKQLDALVGQFPISIEIEDSDLTEEGNQKKVAWMPNIAEALAEIVGMLLALRAESDANLNATIRGLIETGSAKQVAFQAYEYAKANAEFLAYKGKQVERKIPFMFKPGEQQLDKMLQETEVKVKGWENDDKEDIKDILYPVLELAAMWKAQNFRNLGTQSPKSKIKEMIELGLKATDLAKGVLSDDEKKRYEDALKNGENPEPPKKKDFNDFLEEVENGFTSQERITDNVNPYGYPRDNRPRIREIGTTSSGQQ